MKINIVYHNRNIKTEDVANIKELIANNPDKSRRYISQELCRQWNWRQENGALKDMLCRGLLLKLQSDGLISLPAKKFCPNNPFLNRKVPKPIKVDQTPIEGDLHKIKPIEFRSVRRCNHEKVYNALMQEYHYLGYKQHVGEHFKYIAFHKDRPIGCIGWTSVLWYMGCRDRFIGWDAETRQKNLNLIAYNHRLLILPWIRIKNLASYLLGLSTRIIPRDWNNFYNHPIYFVETFVDTSRYKGTCYRASNWICLGNTSGRGKKAPTKKATQPIKSVWGYPLSKDFREELCAGIK